ncbi:MAG: hypothetical protein R3C56_41115 [Pirellulaceae bacterium]
MFVFSGDDHRPVEYDGQQPGIRRLLERLVDFGWNLVFESGLPIAATRDGRSVTLEPGGQIELSGAPLQMLIKSGTSHSPIIANWLHSPTDWTELSSDWLSARTFTTADPLDAQPALRNHASLDAPAW